MKGTILGFDGEAQQLRVGDYVEPLEKEGFGIGIVTRGGLFYKGEAACKVDFENEKNWTARLSKLEVVDPPPPPPVVKTLADFGYKVGDKVAHLKYTSLSPLTITSPEGGTYKGEPCCYTNGTRPTRFSQIKPFMAQQQWAGVIAPKKAEPEVIKITLPSGKVLKIEVE